MIQKISKLDSIYGQDVKEEGNLRDLDKPEELAAIALMNEVMREIRRE